MFPHFTVFVDAFSRCLSLNQEISPFGDHKTFSRTQLIHDESSNVFEIHVFNFCRMCHQRNLMYCLDPGAREEKVGDFSCRWGVRELFCATQYSKAPEPSLSLGRIVKLKRVCSRRHIVVPLVRTPAC